MERLSQSMQQAIIVPFPGSRSEGLRPKASVMDDELRILHEAMVVKERLRVLAELQGTYWDELMGRGFDGSIAEQLVLEWSRHAYGMTFRSVSDPAADFGLDELLADAIPAGPPVPGAKARSELAEPVRSADDPSSVPPGEPWLQLVQDDGVELSGSDDGAEAERRDDRAA